MGTLLSDSTKTARSQVAVLKKVKYPDPCIIFVLCRLNTFVRCKSTCKLALTLYLDETNQSVQPRIYILRTRPTNPYKQGYIFVVKRENVVTSCDSLQLIYRVTPYNNKNSSRDLKGRGNKKTGNPTATTL